MPARVKVKAQGRFKKGDPRPPGAGRRPGSPNRTTVLVKHAILNAGMYAGYPIWDKQTKRWRQTGDQELTGYLTWLSLTHPSAYASLLGRVLPLQITGGDGGPVRIIDESTPTPAAAQAYAESLRQLPPPDNGPMIDITPEPAEEAVVVVKTSLPRKRRKR